MRQFVWVWSLGDVSGVVWCHGDAERLLAWVRWRNLKLGGSALARPWRSLGEGEPIPSDFVGPVEDTDADADVLMRMAETPC
jgi:hypothetical protein